MLKVVTGPMSCGKSHEIIRVVDRALIAGLEVGVFKPSCDTRMGLEYIGTRNGWKITAIDIDPDTPGEILRNAFLVEQEFNGYNLVVIDEAQFFSAELVDVVDHLVGMDIEVVIAGLDMDFSKRGFGSMPELMARADKVIKLTAICSVCKSEANLTQKLIDGEPAPLNSKRVVIEGSDQKVTYEPRCIKCHKVPA